MRRALKQTLFVVLMASIAGCAYETNNAPVAARDGEPTTTEVNKPVLADDAPAVTKAICVLSPTADFDVHGTITFTATDGGVHIGGTVTGLTPGKHGFHVHEFGDITASDGTSTGGHFNPTGEEHGEPGHEHRHVGDLGNIEANESGEAVIDMSDTVIELNGPHSIVGRGIVVHVGEDKFTQPTGDAGGRVAVGVIGIAKGE